MDAQELKFTYVAFLTPTIIKMPRLDEQDVHAITSGPVLRYETLDTTIEFIKELHSLKITIVDKPRKGQDAGDTCITYVPFVNVASFRLED